MHVEKKSIFVENADLDLSLKNYFLVNVYHDICLQKKLLHADHVWLAANSGSGLIDALESSAEHDSHGQLDGVQPVHLQSRSQSYAHELQRQRCKNLHTANTIERFQSTKLIFPYFKCALAYYNVNKVKRLNADTLFSFAPSQQIFIAHNVLDNFLNNLLYISYCIIRNYKPS
jgi:hypothetical protein